jgi:hypothetical protein
MNKASAGRRWESVAPVVATISSRRRLGFEPDDVSVHAYFDVRSGGDALDQVLRH